MKKLVVVIATLTLLLAGCMKKEETAPKETPTADGITVTDIYGEHTLNGPAKKVVALEWSQAEELLALDVQPVAMADIEGFGKWVTIDKKVADGVIDVGQRGEPNIEEIAKAKPDLIIGLKTHEKIKGDLEKIAPVLLFDHGSDEATKDLYQDMTSSLTRMGVITGKEDAAKAAITHLEDKMAQAKEKINAANLATKDFVFTQAYSVNEAPTFRLFTPNGLVSNVLEGMGLTNKIQDQKPQPWGFVESNVEGLAKYQEAMLLHTVQKDDPLFKNLSTNAAWNGLHFVKNNEMYDLGPGVWTFGSVLSMETLVDNVVTTLVK